jgi:arylsulfatase A-like enzyme
VIVTSDHGELFERGGWGASALMYAPVTHIRCSFLLGTDNSFRRQSVTSNVDLLPTILQIASRKSA